jgi:hypothetical protein
METKHSLEVLSLLAARMDERHLLVLLLLLLLLFMVCGRSMLANAHATINRAGDMSELTVVRGRWESCVCSRKDFNVSYLLVSKERGW